MIEKTLSHYEISSQLGKGGMGVVYRAKDQKLGRDVAIKVLPEEFAKDAKRVARFQREAKLLASLNHPNIAAIYGLEESDGTHFLVLELVEGDTLSDRIKVGSIPVEEALKLALQIAEALEAAHEKGVIHRDLKPANIKVTPDGKIKVLDFGLAKAFAGEQAEVNLSHSPTLSEAATLQGVILGTAAYMSPEQARGKPVDKRTDIWAFGCVLYEMLTGQAAFQGEDVTEILAAVVKSEVDLDLLPANIHPRVREVIIRCLQKEQKKRYRDIGDARYEIEQVLADPSGVFVQPVTAAKPRKKLRVGLPWVAAALVLGAIIAGLAVWKLKPTEPRQVMRFDYELPEGQQFSATGPPLAVSPDGKQFVYSTNEGLFLRYMDQLTAKLIAGTEGSAQQPFFSPDGKSIGYFSLDDLQLKKISISGGAPVTLCALTQLAGAWWDADNTIVYGQYPPGSIMRISANGGTPELLAKVEMEGAIIVNPQVLPDEKSVIFTRVQPPPRTVMVQSLESGESKEIFEGDSARYLPTGHLVYWLQNSIFAVPFNLDTLEVVGGPIPIVQGVFRAGGAPQYAISNSGTLIYVPGIGRNYQDRQLVWVDRNGKEEAINAPPRAYVYGHLSPDGSQVALDIRDQENDIWIWDFSRSNLSRLTFDPGMNRGGVWTPDGKRVAFSTERDGAENIYWQAADGSGSPEPLTKFPNVSILPDTFSPDGKQLLYGETGALQNISILSLDGSDEPKVLLGKEEFTEGNSQISPDGRWLAYQSNESGSYQIYVRPFPDVDSGLWQITTEGGTRPLWKQNGRELFYYVQPEGAMMAVPVETETSFKFGAPMELFRGDYLSPNLGTQYSVTEDGKRFLMIKAAETKDEESAAEAPRKIIIVLNWFEELKERVPVP